MLPLEDYFFDLVVVFFVFLVDAFLVDAFLVDAFFAVAISNTDLEQIFDNDVTKNIGN